MKCRTVQNFTDTIRMCNEAISLSEDVRDTHPSKALPERIIKVTEEVGELNAAYIGYVGQNLRKGVTHTADDIVAEAVDVVITALMVLDYMCNAQGRSTFQVLVRQGTEKMQHHIDAVRGVVG